VSQYRPDASTVAGRDGGWEVAGNLARKIWRVSPQVLHAADAFWRPSNYMGVVNTDLAGQLGAASLGARLWRLAPGQASTKHRHVDETELYVVLEGTGRMRIGDDVHTLAPLSSVLVEPDVVRQVFNDLDEDALWLVVGAPPEGVNIREMSPAALARMYPEGPKALPPELAAG
jgi:quercetin dioxygenase-like cupin family protein